MKNTMADEFTFLGVAADRSPVACDFVHLTWGTHASLQAFQESQDFASSSWRMALLRRGFSFSPTTVTAARSSLEHARNFGVLVSGVGATVAVF